MAVAAPLPPRSFRAPSPTASLKSLARSPSPSSPRARVSASPPLHHSPRAARRPSVEAKENHNVYAMDPSRKKEMNGNGDAAGSLLDRPRSRDGSVSEDDEGMLRRRANGLRSPRSPPPGVHTLPTIRAHEALPADAKADDAHAPPPAPSTGASTATTIMTPNGPVVRRRRSSSVKQKPPPGVKPVKVVDWEIPRKVFHSSIGFLTLLIRTFDPPSLWPLIRVLSVAVVGIFLVDLIRLRSPAFAELWESLLGFLMREEERGRINGVVWYIIGVVFVLAAYPRDVAVVSILTLAWSDTTASTLGRMWGRYTPPLPPHFPGIKFLPFAPRKSLAGFMAATVTGFLIGFFFWLHGTRYDYAIINDCGAFGLLLTSAVVGVGGAVVEALDLGLDDNLTLPILSGAVIWTWLSVTNFILGH